MARRHGEGTEGYAKGRREGLLAEMNAGFGSVRPGGGEKGEAARTVGSD